MVNVWAYRRENLGTSFKVAGEWNQVVEFGTLPDLLEKFKTTKLPSGQVGKLGIIAHGNTPGVVQLKPTDLSKKTAHQYAGDFAALCHYLSNNARVIFYSCIAGQSAAGSFLLNELSKKHFPNRHVIGFERYGVASETIDEPAGTVRCSTGGMSGFIKPCEPTATMKPVTDRRRNDEQILNEYSIYAKWSYQGRIIKLPYDERIEHTYSIPDVRCGPEAVKQAVNDTATRANIDYIAISTKSPSNALINLFTWLQEPKQNFTWSKLRDSPAQRLLEFSDEDAKLVRDHHGRLRPNEHIVAVFKKKLTTKYKCASPFCRRHANFNDPPCDNSVALIPNGPFF